MGSAFQVQENAMTTYERRVPHYDAVEDARDRRLSMAVARLMKHH
jgi:hypothetical protein